MSHVREQIASTIDLVVQTARLRDGRRLVARVAVVEGVVEGTIALRDVFIGGGARIPRERVPASNGELV